MARAPFPKARHLAFSLADGGRRRAGDAEGAAAAGPEQAALLASAEALALPLEEVESEQPAALPSAAQPAKGAKAAPDAGLPRALALDLARSGAPEEACAAADG